MKKFNKNIIVFVLVCLFLGTGYSFTSCKAFAYRCGQLVLSVFPFAQDYSFEQFTAEMDQYSTELLNYHHDLMDLNSWKLRLLNTKIVEKDDTVVVKAEEDTLTEIIEYCPDDVINHSASAIENLQSVAKEVGADFLYIAAPRKSMLFPSPENVEDYGSDNYIRFVKALQKRNVPVLDLYEEFRKADMIKPDTYFITDHHWKPETGLWVTEKICSTLQEQYGFEYNEDYTNIENFNQKIYSNWFLGSYGKKTGQFFTESGADDITLITPKFETSFTELQPLKNTEKTGSFQETLLDMNLIQTKDYYGSWTYATYTGGDFRHQIVKNNSNPNGKKFVIVRDSFACVVTPFLALNAGELHIFDTRDFIPSEALDVYDYIHEISPDYVLVLYSGTESASGISSKFQFTLEDQK